MVKVLRDVGLNYILLNPGSGVIHCSEHSTAALSLLITNLHFCKLGSASQQTKNYVLLFFITNMLEEHRPIKGGIFCVEWWGRHRCREMGVGWGVYRNEITKLKLKWLYYHVWCRSPPGLLTYYSQHTYSIFQSSQYCNSTIQFWPNITLILLRDYCINTQLSNILEEDFNGDFHSTGSYEHGEKR